ncbi:hypothetical protein SGLAM104S_05553 [Streptomyces glaucescens]
MPAMNPKTSALSSLMYRSAGWARAEKLDR